MNLLGVRPRAQSRSTILYKPYGNKVSQSNDVDSRQFTDQLWDSDTDLYYYNARYYDPSVGRFTQPDPALWDGPLYGKVSLTLEETVNPYLYAMNNPVKYTDPTGLEIGTLTSNLRMQSGDGYFTTLGNSLSTVGHQGCVVTAWVNIINSINDNLQLTPSILAGDRSNTFASLGVAPSGYVTISGNMGNAQKEQALNDLTTGGWSVFSTTSSIASTLAALASIDGAAYVTGSVDNVDGRFGPHTVNITGYESDGTVYTQGTSMNDDYGRSFSISGDNNSFTQISYALPDSWSIEDFQSVVSVIEASNISSENFWD